MFKAKKDKPNPALVNVRRLRVCVFLKFLIFFCFFFSSVCSNSFLRRVCSLGRQTTFPRGSGNACSPSFVPVYACIGLRGLQKEKRKKKKKKRKKKKEKKKKRRKKENFVVFFLKWSFGNEFLTCLDAVASAIRAMRPSF